MAKCCDPNGGAASFNRQVDFEQISYTPNDSGGQDVSWSVFLANAWVSITPKFIREINFAQRIEPRVQHEIRMRYYPGLTAEMRVKYGSRYFQIKAIINEMEKNEYLKILAEEETGT